MGLFKNKGSGGKLGILSKGKELQEQVDSKVDISTVDFAATYLSWLLYTATTAPLESICRLITGGAAAKDRIRLLRFTTIVIVFLTLSFTLLSLLAKAYSGIVYSLGGILAWYFVYSKTSDTTATDLDNVLQDCLVDVNEFVNSKSVASDNEIASSDVNEPHQEFGALEFDLSDIPDDDELL